MVIVTQPFSHGRNCPGKDFVFGLYQLEVDDTAIRLAGRLADIRSRQELDCLDDLSRVADIVLEVGHDTLGLEVVEAILIDRKTRGYLVIGIAEPPPATILPASSQYTVQEVDAF